MLCLDIIKRLRTKIIILHKKYIVVCDITKSDEY